MRTRQLFRQILLTTLFLLGFFTPAGYAHEGHMPVIVDTDAAVDDIRALALLLGAGADIRFIVTSDGVRSPQGGKQAMKRVLSYFGRPDIPVAAGKSLSAPPPQWRKWNRHLNWPDNAKPGKPGQSGTTPAETAIIDRVQAFAANGQKAVYLCLGPMTNLAAALQETAAIRNAIEGVVYLGREPDAEHPGWNTKRDLPAARQVFDSGLTIYAMGLADKQYPVFDNAFTKAFAPSRARAPA